MKITRCKLLRKHQLRLLEYFVLKVTARSAADLIGIQPNSAALFYRKLREVIAYHLEQKEHEVFDGAVELDESYLSLPLFFEYQAQLFKPPISVG